MGQPFHADFATNLTGKKLILLPVWFYGRKVSDTTLFPAELWFAGNDAAADIKAFKTMLNGWLFRRMHLRHFFVQ